MQFKLKNFDIDKFNRDVNKSLGPDSQYTKWAEYRAEVTGFIKNVLKDAHEAESLMIFGAGNLNDIDMGFLCGKFERIALSDADTQSIKDGLARQELTAADKAKIEIIEADYTGVQKAGLFAGLERLARRAAPADELICYIEKVLKSVTPERLHEEYDFVLSCPLYTQLVYTQVEVFLRILYEYGLYEYNELNKILNAVYGLTPGVLEKYNDLLISACKCGGRIVVFSDVIEMKTGSPLLKKIHRLMEEEPLDSGKIEKHSQKQGIELSHLGIADFEKKAEKVASFYAMWPFSGEKEYLVFGAGFKKIT